MIRQLLFALACYGITLHPVAGLAREAPLKVVASFSIIGDLAHQVGGDRIDLKVLVGPESDSHVYEPRPTDAVALAGADVVLVNGLNFEGFLSRLVEASGTRAPIATLTDGVTILDDPKGGHYHFKDGEAIFHAEPHDPHAWQSPANAKVYVSNIATAFCAVDADGCTEYEQRAAAYNEELDALDASIRTEFDRVPKDHRTVVVAHDAFRYFGAAYGVSFLSPQGISTEAEASAADVAGLIREIRADNARAIFAENISDRRLIERIADEAGMAVAGTLYSDALSAPDGDAPDYLTMLRHNADAIAGALNSN